MQSNHSTRKGENRFPNSEAEFAYYFPVLGRCRHLCSLDMLAATNVYTSFRGYSHPFLFSPIFHILFGYLLSATHGALLFLSNSCFYAAEST